MMRPLTSQGSTTLSVPMAAAVDGSAATHLAATSGYNPQTVWVPAATSGYDPHTVWVPAATAVVARDSRVPDQTMTRRVAMTHISEQGKHHHVSHFFDSLDTVSKKIFGQVKGAVTSRYQLWRDAQKIKADSASAAAHSSHDVSATAASDNTSSPIPETAPPKPQREFPELSAESLESAASTDQPRHARRSHQPPQRSDYPPAPVEQPGAFANEPPAPVDPPPVPAGQPVPADQLQTQALPHITSPDDVDSGDRPVAAADESPRVRRALDEQRQRQLIAQKAAAIEQAASAPESDVQRWESADDEEDLYTYIPPYNLPARDPDPLPTRNDLYRQLFVSVGALAAVASVFWILGWFGNTPALLREGGLEEAYSGGWFSGYRALLTPDYTFYWMWPLLAIASLGHAVFQWQRSQLTTPRQRTSGWYVGSANISMFIVVLALHTGWFWVTLLASVTAAVCLLNAVRSCNLYTARNRTERRLTDGVIGLFFGFALVHAISSISAWLTVHQWHIPGIPGSFWAMAALVVCIWIAAFYAMTERGRITIAIGLAWGLLWLIFPRIFSDVTSTAVALTAAMGAFIVILATQSRRHRINHAERRAAMGRPIEDII